MAGGTQPITFVAYNGTNFAPGARRDLSGRLPDLIDPFDAPIYKGAAWKKAINTRPSWQTDSLSAVTGGTFNVLYNAEPSFTTTIARSEKDNVMEYFYATVNITAVDQAIAKAGGIDSIPDLEAYELEKVWKQVYISWEKKIASAQAQAVDNGSSQKAQMDGLFTAISTNLDTLTGADTTISESDLITKTDAMITAGASKELDLFATVSAISAFTKGFVGRPNARVTAPSSQGEIENYTDAYLTPSGAIVKYHPDRSFVANNGVLLLDMKHLWIRGLMAPSVFRVTEAAGTPHKKTWIQAAWTIDYDNEKRHGAWKGTACPSSF